MANKIRIKRRAAGGASGAPASLENAELAFNEQDDVLYYGKGTGGAGGTATTVIAIGGPGAYAPNASPTLTGTPVAPTAAADTNSTQIATTAFVIGQAASVAPVVNGSAAVGTSLRYARGDHVHPTDTSRAPLASPTFTGTPAAPTAAVSTNTTQLATTAFVIGQGNATAATIAMNGTQASGTSSLYARADHVHPSDTAKANLASPTFTGTPAAPTAAVDTNTTQLATTAYVVGQAYLKSATASSTYAPLASPALTGTPTSSTAAADTNTTQIATTAYVVGQASGTAAAALGSAAAGSSLKYARADHVHAMPTLSQVGTPTANLSLNNFKVTNLADPVDAQDAATKNYVDNVAQGLDAKASVKAATTANITLSATQTIDGISVVAGDRVLVKNQSTASQNGIYVVAAGAWSRAADMSVWAEVPSSFTFVEQGTTQADTSWVISSDAGGTIDTTAINWFQFGSAAAYLAGNGLSLTGNTFAVGGTADRITVNATTVDIAATYVGQTSITTLGTVGTGTWSATAIAADKGGTGQTSYAVGDILFASTTTALSKLSGVATGNVLLSGGVGTAPAYGKVGLTTHVSGQLALANGGTGGTDAASARTNLGLVIGTNVQAYDATLQALAGVTVGADNLIYATAADTFATTSFTTYGRSLVDDVDAAAARTTLGLGTIATQASSNVSITGGSITNLTTFDGITIDGGTF